MGDFTIFGMHVALGTMIYQAALFTGLFLLLRKYVLPNLVAVLENRKLTIEKQLMLAENFKSEGEMYAKEQEALLQQTKVEAKEIIKQSQKEAQAIIKMAKEEANMIISQAYNSLPTDRQRDVG
ncbi:hypothetical protein HHO41_05495 [Bacillus sp. DNRA2]|uniref:F0F1 ATP synthase subunit B family protein n=1 Tax=Bacillus sp. DNRA2 TaxID=2723053 RepID=UPI00145F53C3|nr:hypothetical protein [Bacillus sp. DNRA2]NMD69734.1 hypothetical protein [Bacillus sp. DNRA2]